jgi:alpha-glucosidase (family GH31 glycosyl hydrolase)
MLDDEMHNLYPLLYMKQMYEGFVEHQRLRPVVFTPTGWTGFQAWAGTWTGDTGGGIGTLGGMLNTALVGHGWVTNDMDVAEKEALHFGYLLPWSQINSWCSFDMPWLQGRELAEMHRFYGRLRARLIPYLYTWAREATRTGYPLLAPLCLEFEQDAHCRRVLHEFLLGRDLLVTTFTPDAYLPEGRWQDFWTGAVLDGPRQATLAWPPDRGGGLFVRAGGIVPFGPLMQYRGEKPLDEIELHVFPDRRASRLDFYEDDGVSFEHLQGRHTLTEITAAAGHGEAQVRVGEPVGGFAGQCANRTWAFRVALDFVPARVEINGRTLAAGRWRFDEARRELWVPPHAGPVRVTISR